jgi:multiple sugar transport system ATP-binding protein
MSTQAALSLEGVSRRFGRVTALDRVGFDVEEGSFVVVLGAAGAGKTTTLRAIAGLEDIDAGRIALRGRDADGLAPKDRDIAMIFDNLALYPNKTGFENLASPLRIRNAAPDVIAERVNAVAGTLRIGHVLTRLPRTMSGGERQRVALGRALVREPALFLLDEPLSSLDAMLRVELRAELKRLQREHGYTFLMATPDFQEALAVADVVVMLVGGTVRQIAAPDDLYANPADRDVARFVGAPEINLLSGGIDAARPGRITLLGAESVIDGSIWAKAAAAAGPVEFGLRPEHLAIVRTGEAAMVATISDIEPLGVQAAISLAAGGGTLRSVMPASDALHLSIGTEVGLRPAMNRLLAFDAVTGARLA